MHEHGAGSSGRTRLVCAGSGPVDGLLALSVGQIAYGNGEICGRVGWAACHLCFHHWYANMPWQLLNLPSAARCQCNPSHQAREMHLEKEGSATGGSSESPSIAISKTFGALLIPWHAGPGGYRAHARTLANSLQHTSLVLTPCSQAQRSANTKPSADSVPQLNSCVQVPIQYEPGANLEGGSV